MLFPPRHHDIVVLRRIIISPAPGCDSGAGKQKQVILDRAHAKVYLSMDDEARLAAIGAGLEGPTAPPDRRDH